MSLPERDWRVLRVVKSAALHRYCAKVLEECSKVIGAPGSHPHERYLSLYKLIQERDYRIAVAFKDLRRSTAGARLAAMIELGVVTDEEVAEFTPETREWIQTLKERYRSPGECRFR